MYLLAGVPPGEYQPDLLRRVLFIPVVLPIFL